MDEKRTLLALVLSIAVILVYSEMVVDPYMQRSRAAALHKAAQAATAAVQQNTNTAATAPVASTGAVGTNAPVSAAATTTTLNELESGKVFTVRTNLVEAKVSAKGGRILHLTLLKHKKTLDQDHQLDMITSAPGTSLPLGISWQNGDDGAVQYSNASTDAKQLQLTGVLANGQKIQKQINFSDDNYAINVSASVPGETPRIEWTHHVAVSEAHQRLNPFEFRWLREDNKIDHLLVDSFSDASPHNGTVRWVTFGDRYFIASLVAADAAAPMTASWGAVTLADGAKSYVTAVQGIVGSVAARVYVGPKEAGELAKLHAQLERSIDLGWFSFLAFPLLSALRFLHAVFGNWGLAVVALTLCLKAILLPLTKASFTSMRGMQELQPQVTALRERVTDPTQLNQEMLALYKKHGVNPLGGCFPILLQIPVFIGLYNVLLNAIELRHAPFALWIHDLSAPEHAVIAGVTVPVMVLILGVSMFVQQYNTPSPGMDPAQRKVMLFMPVVLTGSFLAYPLPAGLTLYWVVNNTISIVQQSFIRNDRKMSPYTATAIAGGGMFIFAYVLTLL